MKKLSSGAKSSDDNSETNGVSGYLAEQSQVENIGKFPIVPHHYSVLSDAGKDEIKFATLWNRVEKIEKQRDFILEILPELFHDVRSPFISIIGFSEILRQGRQSVSQIKEFSMDILEEGKSAMKRIDGLEELFSNYLNISHRKVERCNIPEIIDWILAVFDMKISRKKLRINMDFDKQLISENYLMDSIGLKFIFFELLHLIICEAGNKYKIALEGKKDKNHILIAINMDPPGRISGIKETDSGIKSLESAPSTEEEEKRIESGEIVSKEPQTKKPNKKTPLDKLEPESFIPPKSQPFEAIFSCDNVETRRIPGIGYKALIKLEDG